MKTLLLIVAWCLLFVLCWPLALAAIILLPFIWLLSLPFRILGVVVEALLALLKAVLLLPARILRGGPTAGRAP
jgi:hypothetical protein